MVLQNQGGKRRSGPVAVLSYIVLGATVSFLLCVYLLSFLPSSPFRLFFLPSRFAIRDRSGRPLDRVGDSPTDRLSRRATKAESSSSLRSIAIDASLPSIVGLNPAIAKVWDAALKSLRASADASASEVLRKGAVEGVPGTGIKTVKEAEALQSRLDCYSGKGTWVYEEDGGERQTNGAAGLTVHKHSSVLATCDAKFYKLSHTPSEDADDSTSTPSDYNDWNVRESLKYRWVPSPSCAAATKSSSSTSFTPTPLSRLTFCTLLAHKSTLLVGDVPSYSLHDLILDWTSLAPQSCYGDLYCKEHSLCGDILRSSSPQSLEDWTKDERVFNRLPLAPAASKLRSKAPSFDSKEKSPSIYTMLRYRRSDGLRASTAQTIPTYIHPRTGVREVNQPWVADARRSDLVILHKAPLPLPATGFNKTWDDWWNDRSDGSIGAGLKLVEAAWKITEEVWLPEILESLKLLRTPPTPKEVLVVYRGGWRVHSDCGVSGLPFSENDSDEDWNSPGDGPPPLASSPSLHSLLFRSSSSSSTKSSPVSRDVHSTFHNLQTIFQNHLLRTSVLPKFGIPFLDLESSLSVWRSGLVGGSASPSFTFVDQSQMDAMGHSHGAGKGLRSGASGDCLRYCFPSPGMAVEEAFIGGLMKIFEEGWGTKERKMDWIGEGFLKAKEARKGR